MQENGVVGAGGAGFPTYMKLTDKADTFLMNCAECEPLLKLHRQLLEKHAYEIMKTFDMVAETVGASQAIIGIKKSYVKTINALNQHIEEFPRVKIHLLDEVYPMGDEVVLNLSNNGNIFTCDRFMFFYRAVYIVESLYIKYGYSLLDRQSSGPYHTSGCLINKNNLITHRINLIQKMDLNPREFFNMLI